MTARLIPVSFILLLAGCKTYVTQGEHTYRVSAPDRVNRGEDFLFTVTVNDASGQEVTKAIFHWFVDWEGVDGLKHKGKSGISQHIRVKGTPGSAVLHILGYDEAGAFKEIATHVFRVE
jgi:hypothetical protein